MNAHELEETNLPSTREERGFLTNRRGTKLFFTLHGKCSSAATIWIFCNAFFEEQVFSNRAMVLLARLFAGNNLPVLRIDYEGSGNSYGDAEPLRVQDWVDDVVDAANWLRAQYPDVRFSVLGLRAGCWVAGTAAPEIGADQLLLCAPVYDGASYVQELLRANLTMQLSVYKRVVDSRKDLIERLQAGRSINFGGHEVGLQMVESLQTCKISALLQVNDCSCEVIQLEKSGAGSTLASTPSPAIDGFGDHRIHTCKSQSFWGEVRIWEDVPVAVSALVLKLALSGQAMESST
jgi:hypothetical protein